MTTEVSGKQRRADFKTIRKACNTPQLREQLGKFIEAGWTAEELAEYARQIGLQPGRTHPTRLSYQAAVMFGPKTVLAQSYLASFRKPGAVIQPFDHPEPKRVRIERDQREHPDHSEEFVADVDTLARMFMQRGDVRCPEGADGPITAAAWRKAYWHLVHYPPLERALRLNGFVRKT